MLSTFLICILLLSGGSCTPTSSNNNSASTPSADSPAIVENTIAPTRSENNQPTQETDKKEPEIQVQTVKKAPAKIADSPSSAAPVKKEEPALQDKPEVSQEESSSNNANTSSYQEPEKTAEMPKAIKTEVETAPAAAPDHSQWNSLLQKYVNSKGNVNYAGFKQDKSALEAYLQQLADQPVESSWSREEKLAYWINAYNAFTVKLIVDNLPVKSITNLKGGKPWDDKWIKLGSKVYSLNQIENDIIRPSFKEPRIHFAVNCAAKSCPPLLNKAWTADKLNSYFEQQARAFINNPNYNKISANSIQVSKIFDWYGEDFGNLIDYLNKYSTTKINADAKVSFLEYDWSLNNQ